jgi:two-component system, sensor histidine kinase PdtaS
MTLIHEHLYQGSDISQVDLEHYVKSLGTMLFQNYQQENKRIRFEVRAPQIFMDINMAIPIGLVTNELITNSLKYAFEGKDQGTISITCTGTK